VSGPWEQFQPQPPAADQPGPWAAYAQGVDALPPATLGDRVQATEAGILKGGAYLAALPLDTVANAYNLAKAGVGTAYSGLTGKPVPPALEVNSEVSPVGAALTRLMDKSPLTTTQVNRPDDAASRYLSTAGSVVPGAVAGGGAVPAVTRGVVTAAVPAAAGQYVAEARPFESDTANNAAAVLTQALGTYAMPRGQGPVKPENSIKNTAVQQGQDAGYVFPPATTNPTGLNRAVETLAGKEATQQHASVRNQEVTNNLARQELGLPPAKGAVTDLELASARAAASPGYDAIRSAGTISAPANFAAQLDAVLSKNQGAARLSPTLKDTALEQTVEGLKNAKTFDASDAVDTISVLRDKASEAYRRGDNGAGKAYRDLSGVLENAVESDLAGRGGQYADVVKDYRASRQQFAKIHDIEAARNGATGNVVATKLAAALKNDAPLSGGLRTIGEAAAQAPRAFAEPTHSAGVSHLDLYGMLAGALGGAGISEHAFGSPYGAAAALAIPAGRAAARGAAFGPLQRSVLPRDRAALLPNALLGALPSLTDQ
jgi:hypothetical protein